MSDRLLFICRVCKTAETFNSGPCVEDEQGNETCQPGICESCCGKSEDGHEYENESGEVMCKHCGSYPPADYYDHDDYLGDC